MTGQLHLERDEVGVAILTIDHPPMNTFNQMMTATFLRTLTALEEDLTVRCLIVTGAGRAFCCGEDMKTDVITPADLDALTELLNRVEAARMPVIAAINGFCAGGGMELAFCSDIRIAADTASFICAGVNMGGLGGTWRLPRLIGPGRAKEMLLTGERHDAETAYRYGLVTSLHPADHLMPAARKLAHRIATRAPLSVEATKRQVNRMDLGEAEANRLFDLELKALIETADHREALAAFNARREPAFHRS